MRTGLRKLWERRKEGKVTQLQAWLEMMTHGEFRTALVITVVVAMAYGLAIPYLHLLWPLWSGAWDYVERRLR